MDDQGGVADEGSNISASIILGTLNECENISGFIHQLQEVLGKSHNFEIIVVDDGSTDGTIEKLTQLAAADGRVIPVFNKDRRGLLASNLQGIAIAKGDYKVVMDSDWQHPPEKLPNIVENLEKGNDVVICSRYIAGGNVGGRNGLRGLISHVATFMGKIALRNKKPVQDNISGYFGFRKEIRVPKPQGGNGFKTLLYLLALNPQANVIEIPYGFRQRKAGQSKIVSTWRFIPRYLIEIMNVARLSYRSRREYKSLYSQAGGNLQTERN